ncbi:protein disulfide-isomerase precursor [Teratosphaeriaceae sp. CCFEE 6253]|nr:protein disulfide-isomerase precursor [Teratosphaeriaceae sp. CCFEE 6253]
MRYTTAGLVGLAALAVASDVHDLTGDSFPSFVQDHGLVLAECTWTDAQIARESWRVSANSSRSVFAPWCGHCKALAPEYEEAATTLKDKDIALAKIDCTAEQELCQTYGVEGYPTLKVFRGTDNIQPYSGPRKAQAIVSYMTKQSLPSVSLLQSSEALEEFKTADKVVLVAFFGKDDKTSNATFEEVADELRDSFLFGSTSDPALAKAEGVSQPAIVLYKTFDEGKNSFEEGFTKDKVVQFAKTASTPLIGEVGPETYAGYMAAGIPLAYIFAETPEERDSLAKTLKPIAEKQKGKLNFATIDAKAFGQHAGNLNLELGKWPAFAIQDTQKNQKFPYTAQGSASDLSEKKIGKFVDDFVSGAIEPSVKSEPVPEKQDGPVTIVVAKNYQDVVIDNDKDVLLEFYAPWCGHCKALAPKYDELAGMFKSHSDKVTIAKVDATLNDVPDEIQGFPTIKLFKAGSKDAPVDYTGSRTVEDLAAFIRDNGSNKIDVTNVATESMEGIETDQMPMQAPAATEKASSASTAAESATGGIKSKISEAAQVVKDSVIDSDEIEEHDEL